MHAKSDTGRHRQTQADTHVSKQHTQERHHRDLGDEPSWVAQRSRDAGQVPGSCKFQHADAERDKDREQAEAEAEVEAGTEVT